MKRAMAQATQCVHCLQPVKKGWGQLNHKKICMGAPATYKVTQTKTANQVDTEDDDNHNIHEMEGEGQDEAQDSGLHFGFGMAPYESVAVLNERRYGGAYSESPFGTKDARDLDISRHSRKRRGLFT